MVRELHVYQPPIFIPKSIANFTNEKYLNNLFRFIILANIIPMLRYHPSKFETDRQSILHSLEMHEIVQTSFCNILKINHYRRLFSRSLSKLVHGSISLFAVNQVSKANRQARNRHSGYRLEPGTVLFGLPIPGSIRLQIFVVFEYGCPKSLLIQKISIILPFHMPIN